MDTPKTISVTGGTGVLGRSVVGLLVEAGWPVRVAVRDESRREIVEALGARPQVCDLFDADAVRDLVGESTVVLHLATSIPPIRRMASRRSWADNDRLRSETTRLLVDAALAQDVEVLVAESVTFTYPDGGDRWIDESDDLPSPHPRWQSLVDLETEVARFAASGRRGIVARFGLFYGPQARSVDESLKLARWRGATVAGAASSYLSSIHTDDAARAVVATLDDAVPSGTYNVVDDEPLTRREYLDAFSAAFELGRLRCVPTPIMRAVGGGASRLLTASQRVSNHRFRSVAGWEPQYSSARDGWPAVAAERREVE